ncbi:MAG TPA: hypothetical protein VF160_01255 [Candidatus Dormibacteraeota bacterium]
MKVRLLVLLVFLTACGQASPAARPAAADRVYVLAPGSQLLGLDAGSGRVAARLPLAVLSPDWNHAYAVSGDRLQILDPSSGAAAGNLDLPAGYQLPMTTADGKPGGLSHSGRWLILAKGSSFLEIDLQALRIAHRVDLPGSWAFDGIDDSGARLYLTHYLDDQARSYNVTLYHLDSGQIEGPIVQKGDEDEAAMQGRRLSALTDRWGAWQYSVYSRPGGAFIHMLSLRDDFAWCLDLPGSGTPDEQAAWSLAISPTGDTLLAVNPLLKQALAFSLSSESPGGPPGKAAAPDWAGWAVRQPLLREVAPASDGKQLYALVGERLLVVDTSGATAPRALPLSFEPLAILGVHAV